MRCWGTLRDWQGSRWQVMLLGRWVFSHVFVSSSSISLSSFCRQSCSSSCSRGRVENSSEADVQDIEATLHCIRYSSEAVPLGEEVNLPILFGNDILGALAQRPISGKGEERLRLTVVCLIRMSSLPRKQRTEPILTI